MSITNITVASPAGETIFTDTAMGSTADAVKASSALVYAVIVDNTANASAVYVKLYNVASGSVTVGTTAPDEIILAPASVVTTVTYFTASAPGKTLATALTACCVTAGGTAGTTAPSSSVSVSITYV